MNDLDKAAAEFTALRGRLFGIAYRMLGSAGEAEDLVQDVWVRWQGYDRATVDNPGAFLATITTRLAINELTSARARRVTYVGPWLPEPVDTAADPYLGAETGSALDLAALTLMEKLTPHERAAYVLREAFDYPYGRIAGILRSTEPAVRQLVSRARKHVAGDRRTPVDAEAHRELLAALLAAARQGDLAGLEKLFAADVTSVSDGNGRHRVARKVVTGREKVARFLANLHDRFGVGTEVTWTTANGHPAVLLHQHGDLYALAAAHVTDGRIDRLFWIINPDKLAAYHRPS